MEEQKNTYENVTLEPDVGFDIRFVTMDHNSPFHWHREMEILYILNGHATVHMEGEEYELNPLDAIVMDYARIHEVIYALPQTMGICIHVSRQLLRRYLPETEPFAIRCAGQRLLPGQQEYYNEICGYLKELTVLYVNQNETYRLKARRGFWNCWHVWWNIFPNRSPWWQRRRGRAIWSGWSRSVRMWIITTGKK